LLEEFSATRKRGFSVSKGEIAVDSTTIAAPILGVDGQPSAAVAITAPSKRMSATHHRRIGAMLCNAARTLSRGALGATSHRNA
jgi:DNA-binding IclR family transcriptional regulator